MIDDGLSAFPAEKDDFIFHAAGKVEQSGVEVLDLNADFVDFGDRFASTLDELLHLGAASGDPGDVDVHASREVDAAGEGVELVLMSSADCLLSRARLRSDSTTGSRDWASSRVNSFMNVLSLKCNARLVRLDVRFSTGWRGATRIRLLLRRLRFRCKFGCGERHADEPGGLGAEVSGWSGFAFVRFWRWRFGVHTDSLLAWLEERAWLGVSHEGKEGRGEVGGGGRGPWRKTVLDFHC